MSSASISITEMEIISAPIHDCTTQALIANGFLDLPGFNGGVIFLRSFNFAPERFVSHVLALVIFENCRTVLLLPSKGDKIKNTSWGPNGRKAAEKG